jgi:hypothetical protein
VDVEEAFSHIASRSNSIQRRIQSHGWRYASFGPEEDSVEERLVPRCELSWTDAVQKLCLRDSIDRYASHFSTYPQVFLEGVII